VQKLGPTWPHPNSIGCEFHRREAFYTHSVAAHVELAFVLVRVQNPSRSYSRRAGFVLTTPRAIARPALAASSINAFTTLRANAAPSQSAVYKQLAEEQSVVFLKAL